MAVRFIFIYRNIFDVVRSAKARKFLKTINDFIEFVRRWDENVRYFLQNPRESILAVQYEKLIMAPEIEIGRIESFSRVSGIKREVLGKKINTFCGEKDKGYSPSSYIEPEELTNDEIRLIKSTASKALEITGYSADQ